MKPGDLVVCYMKGWTHDDVGIFLEYGEKMPEENDHRKKGIIMTTNNGVIETVCFTKAPCERFKEFWSIFESR
jgi:hypothetical protein